MKQKADPLATFVGRGRKAQAAIDALIIDARKRAADDARAAYELFTTMRTAELRVCLAAHRADLKTATKPDTIAFCAGRAALIAAVLKTRTKP